MKLVVYIIAILAIAGAAFLSKQNITSHEEQLTKTKEQNKKVIAKRVDVEDEDNERIAEVKLRDEQENINIENVETKRIRETDVKNETKLSGSFDDELETLLTEKERINQVIVEIERELQGINVPLEEIESFVTSKEDEKKSLTKRDIALKEEVAIFKGSVEANKSVIENFKASQIKRRNNLNANRISSLITAVDSEWGFVVVKPHEGAIIKPESKLVVIRGNKHIGRLTINAIENEAGRVLANIDYSSLVRGMRIRPGDRVILSEPITQ